MSDWPAAAPEQPTEHGTGSVRRGLTLLVVCAVPTAGLWWLLAHRSTVDQGSDTLAGGRPGWLAAAAGIAALTWIAGAVCQQGAVLRQLPRMRLLAVQIAGSLANHLLPSGVGVGAVNVRFLRQEGMTRASAVAAVGLNTAAGIAVHAVAVIVLVASGLTPLRLGSARQALLTVGIGGGVALLLLALPPVRVRLRRLRATCAAEVTALRGLGANPVRVSQLWLGSAAVPFLHAATLVLVGTALQLPLGVGAVVGAYFISSALAALLPSPGGFGSLDAALTVALVSGGVPTATALATTLGYRVLTVWIPLLPASGIFVLLLRRHVI